MIYKLILAACLSTLALSIPLESTLSVYSSPQSKDIVMTIVARAMPLIKEYRNRDVKSRPVIAVGGCSGVGKSFFAEELLAECRLQSIQAKILHLDDFLDPGPFEGAIKEIHPAFDWLRLHLFLKEIYDGAETIEKPIRNRPKQTPAILSEKFDLKGIELLIFEGEFSLFDAESYDLVKYADIRVLIDAKNEDLIDWDWKRARNLPTNSFEEFRQLRTDSLNRYRMRLERCKLYADFIFKKSANHSYSLLAKTENHNGSY